MGNRFSLFRKTPDTQKQETEQQLSEALNTPKVTELTETIHLTTSEPTPTALEAIESEKKCQSIDSKCEPSNCQSKDTSYQKCTDEAMKETVLNAPPIQTSPSSEEPLQSSEPLKEEVMVAEEKSTEVEEEKKPEETPEVKVGETLDEETEKKCLCDPCQCDPCKCCQTESGVSQTAPQSDSNEEQQKNETQSQPQEQIPEVTPVIESVVSEVFESDDNKENKESEQQNESPIEEKNNQNEGQTQDSQNVGTEGSEPKVEETNREAIEEINDNVETPQELNEKTVDVHTN